MGATRQLADYVARTTFEQLPQEVVRESKRCVLNYLGVALGASRHQAVRLLAETVQEIGGHPQATLLGSRARSSAPNAAMVNGAMSHVLDFDDTHLATVIHPTGPVLSAALPLAEWKGLDGRRLITGLALGMEAELRVGTAVYPSHYDVGWHITGTTGPFGAAAAAGKLLCLSEQQMVWALGLAASQPVGLRESFGSMTKSFNPGRAASNGLFAALLAAKNFTSSDGMIEAKRGWANTISTKQDYREITEGLGQRYEAALNTYKPFACGIVIHPAIDAAIQLRNEYHLAPDQIVSVELRANPLVLELTGKKAPATGLEGKFSVYHAVAVALVEGAAGEKQFSDRAVRDPRIVALRQKVHVQVDPAVLPKQVDMRVVLADGRKLHRHIAHAVGSLEVPMSDRQLETKFTDLAEGILPPEQIQRLMNACWSVADLPDAAAIAQAAVPAKT